MNKNKEENKPSTKSSLKESPKSSLKKEIKEKTKKSSNDQVLRRNRRYVKNNKTKNRLQRAQYASDKSDNKKETKEKREKPIKSELFRFKPGINVSRRRLFVGGLPKSLDNRGLYNLFINEGKLVGCNIIYDKLGISRGFAIIEFANPRDAWNTIQRWNNTEFRGFNLRIEYKNKKTTNLYHKRRRYFNGHYESWNNYHGYQYENYKDNRYSGRKRQYYY
jgi:RNA recognition motif-containing protein